MVSIFGAGKLLGKVELGAGNFGIGASCSSSSSNKKSVASSMLTSSCETRNENEKRRINEGQDSAQDSGQWLISVVLLYSSCPHKSSTNYAPANRRRHGHSALARGTKNEIGLQSKQKTNKKQVLDMLDIYACGCGHTCVDLDIATRMHKVFMRSQSESTLRKHSKFY